MFETHDEMAFTDQAYSERMTLLLKKIGQETGTYSDAELIDLFFLDLISDSGEKLLRSMNLEVNERRFPGTVRSILIIRPVFIGDVIMTLPTIKSLKWRYPGVEIDYLTQAPCHHLLTQLCPDLRRVYELPYRSVYGRMVRESGRLKEAEDSFFQLIKELRSRRYSVVINLHNALRTAVLASLLKRPHTLGLSLKQYGNLRLAGQEGMLKLAMVQLYRQKSKEPVTTIDLINNASETPPATYPMKLETSYKLLAGAAARLTDAGVNLHLPFVGIHPGANWHSKRWSPDYFSTLARLIAEKMDCQVLVFCGPGDEFRVQTIVEKAGSRVTGLPHMDLVSFAGILSRCGLFISGDTGPMHLAAALDVPQIGIMGTSVNFVYAREAVLLLSRFNCPAHCPGPRDCQLEKDRCIDRIRPSDVMRAADFLLHRRAYSSQEQEYLRVRSIEISQPLWQKGKRFSHRFIAGES
jgi:ADP-heptose:LPS heptosyltransferase